MQITQTPVFKSSDMTTRNIHAKSVATTPASGETQMSKDQGIALGKASHVIAEINLLDEDASIDEIVKDAISELGHGGRMFPDLDENQQAVPQSTFAEREAKMSNHLLSKLNALVISDDAHTLTYKFPDKMLKEQINKLKTELKDIENMRRMGVTDCWGGLTNRQVACAAAINAIEKCLQSRKQLGQMGFPKITCEPMPTYPPFRKI